MTGAGQKQTYNRTDHYLRSYLRSLSYVIISDYVQPLSIQHVLCSAYRQTQKKISEKNTCKSPFLQVTCRVPVWFRPPCNIITQRESFRVKHCAFVD